MKKLILVIVFAWLINHVYAQKSFYEQIQEPDSIFSIYLEEDTLHSRSIYLVFKNNSSDSIVLKSDFENFDTRFKSRPGFLICFYFNHELGLPNWGESRPDHFKFSNGVTQVSPRSKIRFQIELPYIGKIRDDIEKGIIFEVFYFYYNATQKKASSFYVTTNYLNLKYLKRFEKESQ
jgi:hypothetical protein